jgi:hypothetical protein
VVDHTVGRFALEIDVDDSEIWLLLTRQAEGVSRCGGWSAHLHAFGFKEQPQRIGNGPMILHNKDVRTPQVCARAPFNPPVA